jgi:hypothetical protein
MSPTIIQKPKISIDPEILRQTEELVSTESQVIVHCIINAPWYGEIGIRIWPTTYLYDLHSTHRSELVHYENISPYPDWKILPAATSSYFTLIFSGLPKSCTVFDLKEEIPESHGFEVRSIKRNESDVYYVQF